MDGKSVLLRVSAFLFVTLPGLTVDAGEFREYSTIDYSFPVELKYTVSRSVDAGFMILHRVVNAKQRSS